MKHIFDCCISASRVLAVQVHFIVLHVSCNPVLLLQCYWAQNVANDRTDCVVTKISLRQQIGKLSSVQLLTWPHFNYVVGHLQWWLLPKQKLKHTFWKIVHNGAAVVSQCSLLGRRGKAVMRSVWHKHITGVLDWLCNCICTMLNTLAALPSTSVTLSATRGSSVKSWTNYSTILYISTQT